MRTELITIETDTIPIEGLYYEPTGKIMTIKEKWGCKIFV